MLFTANRPPLADHRDWGGLNWWQNLRLPYYSMLQAGDNDEIASLFDQFNRTLPVVAARMKAYFGFDGLWWPEYTHPVSDCCLLSLQLQLLTAALVAAAVRDDSSQLVRLQSRQRRRRQDAGAADVALGGQLERLQQARVARPLADDPGSLRGHWRKCLFGDPGGRGRFLQQLVVEHERGAG